MSTPLVALRQARADFEGRHGYVPSVVRMSVPFRYALLEEDVGGAHNLDLTEVCGMKIEVDTDLNGEFELR